MATLAQPHVDATLSRRVKRQRTGLRAARGVALACALLAALALTGRWLVQHGYVLAPAVTVPL